MASSLEPGQGSISPESSGRNTPVLRQWRNQLDAEEAPTKDKAYRKYASGIERALSLFDTNLEEWADYISFLSRLLKALQARQSSITSIPSKALVAKRLSQCLNPLLPSGVHQKAIEVYNYVFSVIGDDGLSRDLPLYLPGLASTLSFASLTVRAPFLELLERYFLNLAPRALRPAMKSVILALLPGLEEETSDDFERTLKLLENFKIAIRARDSRDLTPTHSTGDDFFWQCFFLASITSQSRRPGALAYLVRNLPKLDDPFAQESAPANPDGCDARDGALAEELASIVTSPEPGLLIRCFAAGLADEQLLIQRGFLDLLVTHLPLHSRVLQKKVKPEDLELLLRAAAGVVIRRDMSLNRRLWAWFLGPEPAGQEHENGVDSPSALSDHQHGFLASKTSYFEEFGLQSLTSALLAMIHTASDTNPAERARPYRICLSLMDRWEIGGLVVPEIFLPVIKSVRSYKSTAASKAEFNEVLRSASVFFDGVESGLIYGELVALIAQAIGQGNMADAERAENLALVQFVMTHFNVREEEMITIHAPLAGLSILAMIKDVKDRNSQSPADGPPGSSLNISDQALGIALNLLDLIPDRAFPTKSGLRDSVGTLEGPVVASMPNGELLKKIRNFYVADQGNLEAAPLPFSARTVGELLLKKACILTCDCLTTEEPSQALAVRSRLLTMLLFKAPQEYSLDTDTLLSAMRARLSNPAVPFASFRAMLSLATQLYTGERIPASSLSDLVEPLVRHAWRFLSLSEPKFHVETVRCLWQLQTALGPHSRDIEGAIAYRVLANDTTGTFAIRPADAGRSFSLLWSHTLQDGADRRTPKTPGAEARAAPRLSGQDYYEVMLTRPLFLMLDSLLDDRTQLFMAVKSWLNSMNGIEKYVALFASRRTLLIMPGCFWSL